MFKPTKVIAVLALLIVSLIGPAHVADAHDGGPVQTVSWDTLSHVELTERIERCLELLNGVNGLKFQMDLIGPPGELGEYDPVRNLFIVAFLLDPSRAEYQQLECQALLRATKAA